MVCVSGFDALQVKCHELAEKAFHKIDALENKNGEISLNEAEKHFSKWAEEHGMGGEALVRTMSKSFKDSITIDEWQAHWDKVIQSHNDLKTLEILLEELIAGNAFDAKEYAADAFPAKNNVGEEEKKPAEGEYSNEAAEYSYSKPDMDVDGPAIAHKEEDVEEKFEKYFGYLAVLKI